jgi:hypothetical protein
MKNPLSAMAEKFRGWSNAQRGLGILLAAVFLLIVVGGRRAGETHLSGSATAPTVEPELQQKQDYDVHTLQKEFKELQTRGAAIPEEKRLPMAPGPVTSLGLDSTSAAMNPLMAHTAELTVATREFARSRETMEEILERHRGYAAKLRMVGQKSGSVLAATLRVPATELGGTVSDLKALGDVEREEQAADEITQQRADLDARLTNARKTLLRLQELLQKQTYPDGNVRELQRQIGNATAEVARLEAERRSSEQRVIFANVLFTLRETVATPSESFGAQLRSALLSGFGDAMASLSAILVFLMGRGPVVLLWCVILWLPVRWIWKRLSIQQSAAVPGA